MATGSANDAAQKLMQELPAESAWIRAVKTSTPFPIVEQILTSALHSIKQGKQRQIIRIDRPEPPAWYWKISRIENWRAWFRDLFRGPKAKLEFENSQQLLAHAIPTMECIAWSGCRFPPRQSHLLTVELPGPVLTEWFTQLPLTPALLRKITNAVAVLFAQLHRAHFFHPDPHPGNIFIAGTTNTEIQLGIFDVHDLERPTRLTVEQIEKSLMLLNRWFSLRTSRSQRLRFWRKYNQLAEQKLPDDSIREIEQQTERSNVKLWRSRANKCISNNRFFQQCTLPGWKGFAIREVDPSLLKICLRFIQSPQASDAILKDSASSLVLQVTIAGKTYILKLFRCKKRTHVIRNLFRPSAGKRSWLYGHALRDRLLPTPSPLFLLERRYGPFAKEALLLTEYVTNPGDIKTILPLLNRQQLQSWIHYLAVQIRTLHERGFRHRDLKAANILVATTSWDQPAICWVDLVGMEERGIVSTKRRQKDLTRLLASFLAEPRITQSMRRRFLQTYLREDTADTENWRIWWKRIEQQVLAKQRRNKKHSRPLH